MAKLLIFRGIYDESRCIIAPHTYLVEHADSDYTTQHGTIAKEELQKPDGSTIHSNTGKSFILLSASFHDIHNRLKKLPQTIPHKDLGSVAVHASIKKDSTVLDCGLGSGALALFLASICKQVIAYEKNPATIAVAGENILRCDMHNITVKEKDIIQGIDETELDAITLDIPEPWKVVGHAATALKSGGYLVAYTPTVNQIATFNDVVATHPHMTHEHTLELIERAWKASHNIQRPVNTPIGHSGFLSFARCIREKKTP